MKKDTIIAISWYQARLQQFLQIFSQLGLKPTGIELKYKVGEIEFYEKSYIEKFGKVFVQLYSNKPEMIKKLWNDLDVSP